MPCGAGNEAALVKLARELSSANTGRWAGERNSGGADKPSILADVVEAMIGAVYVDGGFDAAKGVVLRLMENSFDAVLSGSGVGDYKTRLQEHYHKKGISDIRYVVYKEEGPPHDGFLRETHCCRRGNITGQGPVRGRRARRRGRPA